MNTASKVLLVALLFAAPAFAQNVRVDNVTFSSVQGFPFLPGATITICMANATGLPCSPTVAGTCLSISDATCNQSATLTSDALGNYGFWIQPGSYSYTVTKAGFGGFGPKPLTLACTPVASCTVTGAVTVNSPGSITAGAGVPTSLTNLTVSGTVASNLTIAGPSPWIDVTASPYSAKGDDTTDDTTAIMSAVKALPQSAGSGGTIFLPYVTGNGYYKVTKTIWNANSTSTAGRSHVHFVCAPGAGIDYEPTSVGSGGDFSRAWMADWAETSVPANQPITGAIAVGATSFTSTNTPNPSPVAGQWILINEFDPGINDLPWFTWAQVLSVVGTTINVQQPLNEPFPNNTGAGNTFYNVLQGGAVEDVGIENCNVQQGKTGLGVLPAIALMRIRNGFMRRNTAINANGQPLYTFEASDASITDNKTKDIFASNPTDSEFSHCVSCVITGNRFETESTSANNGGGVLIDLGMNNFVFNNNTIGNSFSICILVQNGVYNGTIANNQCGVTHGGNGQGIAMSGAQQIVVKGNTFNGQQGGGINACLSAANSTGTTALITSQGNVFQGNQCGSTFTSILQSTLNAGDSFDGPNSTNGGGWQVQSGLQIDHVGNIGGLRSGLFLHDTSGGANPFKHLRVNGGVLQVTNSADSAVIFQVQDGGAVQIPGTGTLTVGAGASLGAITNATGLQVFNTATTCTTAATINTPCTTASITLPVGYADTNYRLSISCLGVTAFPQVQTYTKSNTTFTITLNNLTAAAATCSSFDIIAGHN